MTVLYKWWCNGICGGNESPLEWELKTPSRWFHDEKLNNNEELHYLTQLFELGTWGVFKKKKKEQTFAITTFELWGFRD